MQTIEIKVHKEPGNQDLSLPNYQTDGASGMDLCATPTEETVIKVGEIKLIPTGLRVSIPKGYEAQIRPRSGLALKSGITMLNTPGTIDSDYRGLIGLIVINLGKKDFVVKRGMRMAQMVIQEVVKAIWVEETCLDETSRSDGGFGHTGT